MQRFDVSVVTGDKECAGTDANVFINVIGSLGKEWWLNLGFFDFLAHFYSDVFLPITISTIKKKDGRSKTIEKGCFALIF